MAYGVSFILQNELSVKSYDLRLTACGKSVWGSSRFYSSARQVFIYVIGILHLVSTTVVKIHRNSNASYLAQILQAEDKTQLNFSGTFHDHDIISLIALFSI